MPWTLIMATPTRSHTPFAKPQRGVGLVELMIGMTIGMLTVAAAMGAVMVSRSLSGTVSEVSQLQQQAAYAFRVIGQQIRQSGGRVLKPAESATEFGEFDNNPALAAINPISGKDAPSTGEFTLSIAYQNSMDKSYPLSSGSPVARALVRNCLGENPGIAASPALMSQFRITNNQLMCAGADGASQSIISNVNDFHVTYLMQNNNGNEQTFQYIKNSQITNNNQWLQVYAIEVCLELSGREPIETAGSTYVRCDGSEADRGNRLRMVFKNIFYINNHSWKTSS